jgi:hypothetical protein
MRMVVVSALCLFVCAPSATRPRPEPSPTPTSPSPVAEPEAASQAAPDTQVDAGVEGGAGLASVPTLEVAWRRSEVSSATALFETGNGPAVLVTSGGRALLLDARTGAEVWSATAPEGRSYRSGAVARVDGSMFLFVNESCEDLNVRPRLVRLDRADGHVIFQRMDAMLWIAHFDDTVYAGDRCGVQAMWPEDGRPLGPFWRADEVHEWVEGEPGHRTFCTPSAHVLATTGGVALVRENADPVPWLAAFGKGAAPLWRRRAAGVNVAVLAVDAGRVTWLATSFSTEPDRVDEAVLETVDLRNGRRLLNASLGSVRCAGGRHTVNARFNGPASHPEAVLVNLCDEALLVDRRTGEVFARRAIVETPVIRGQENEVYVVGPPAVRWLTEEGALGARIDLPERPVAVVPAGDRLVVEASSGTRLVVLDADGSVVLDAVSDRARPRVEEGVVVAEAGGESIVASHDGRLARVAHLRAILGLAPDSGLVLIETTDDEVLALTLPAE